VVPILSQPPTALDLFATAATAKLEGQDRDRERRHERGGRGPGGRRKPASELQFDETDIPVLKLAHTITVSDELLDDAPALANYLSSRLSLFLRQQEEAQVLGGQGGDNLLGLLPQIPEANRFVVSAADTPNAADHIHETISVAERSWLWNRRVVVTNSVPVGYEVVGSFGLGATIYRRGGTTVEASNSAGVSGQA
jgi:hypothetical protein